ncbi:sporulation inhibitor of replication protein SirA [Calidifontibacillus oryziterrae]|uniref:sporulation inhibitor of replication protein SirA n=1 Tax=Calidifontibacillus oryziterrae TaxID=1191699 RepID=UPI000319A430|nr:sporulation inhibitor of replication protein SirA [Calidifontibacillus oryziterrae]
MRNYQIYLLREDVAYDYFGKERLIYNLFVEKLHAKSREQLNLIEKQINYITKPLSVIEINRFIEKNFKEISYEHNLQFLYKVETNKVYSTARLGLKNRYILLEADGTFDAETTFFEVLRKYNSCFLAMDFENNHFGWLNPIKQKRYV